MLRYSSQVEIEIPIEDCQSRPYVPTLHETSPLDTYVLRLNILMSKWK